MLALSWYTGTAVELLDVAVQAAASTSMPDENPVFIATIAALAAESGDRDLAERSISRVGDLDALLPTSSWLMTVFSVGEAAMFLADADLAEMVYEALMPFADLPVLPSAGISCFGSARRQLGVMARIAGRVDEAVEHLERAVDQNRRLGNRPLTAVARADLAETLLMRDGHGDRERAAALLDQALDAARGMNLHGRIDRLVELRDATAAPSNAPQATFQRHESGWEVVGAGERALVADTVGMRYLAVLLASPGVDVSAAQLAGVEVAAVKQEVLDATALESFRRRLSELEHLIDEAVLSDDASGAARHQSELDELVAHMRVSAGLQGRSRRFDDPSERARTAVQKAIRRAITTIGRDAPKLANALDASIRTGHECRFEPVDGMPGRWLVRSTT
jgi:hypothetical protein